MYRCASHSSHAPTDQNWLVGCRDCLVDQYSASTDFFRPKHVYESGDEIRPGITQFVQDPRSSVVTIESSGEKFRLDSPFGFISHWLSSGRADLKWNTRHQTPNILVSQVDYGVAGSGTTAMGRFTSDVTGVLIAKALTSDAHPYPVNPGAVAWHLTDWPSTCACGAKAPQNAIQCLACTQRSEHA